MALSSIWRCPPCTQHGPGRGTGHRSSYIPDRLHNVSSSAVAATAVQMTLVAVMGRMRITFYPWACAAAENTANIVTTNAASLSRVAFRSSSAGLSAVLEFVLDLSGSAAVGPTEVANKTVASLNEGAAAALGEAADDFWSSSPLGMIMAATVTPVPEEGVTAVVHAAGAFWACPATEAVGETVVPLVEKGAATVVDAISHLWISACVGGGEASGEDPPAEKETVLVVVDVRVACHFCKLRAARAGLRGLQQEEKSALRQAKALKKSYTDNFRKRGDQQKALYRLRDRVIEATRWKGLEAKRDTRRAMGCRLLARSLSNAKTTMVATMIPRWKVELVDLEKVVGVDGGGSGMDGDMVSGDGGAAQDDEASGLGGVGAPRSGYPAPGNGNASPR